MSTAPGTAFHICMYSTAPLARHQQGGLKGHILGSVANPCSVLFLTGSQGEVGTCI